MPDAPSSAAVLADFLSGDSHRIWSAAWAVIQQRAGGPALDELTLHLSDIRRATQEVELGGVLYPNKAVLAQALRVLELRAAGLCHCAAFPSADFLLYDPLKEEQLGRVKVLRTSTPGWDMTYWCQCRQCGAEFEVEQHEGHMTWWRWTPRLAESGTAQ